MARPYTKVTNFKRDQREGQRAAEIAEYVDNRTQMGQARANRKAHARDKARQANEKHMAWDIVTKLLKQGHTLEYAKMLGLQHGQMRLEQQIGQEN